MEEQQEEYVDAGLDVQEMEEEERMGSGNGTADEIRDRTQQDRAPARHHADSTAGFPKGKSSRRAAPSTLRPRGEDDSIDAAEGLEALDREIESLMEQRRRVAGHGADDGESIMTDGVSATAERWMSIRNDLAQREAQLEQAELVAAEKAAAAKLAASRVTGSAGSGKPPKLHQAKPAKVMPVAQDHEKNEGSASPVQGIDDIPRPSPRRLISAVEPPGRPETSFDSRALPTFFALSNTMKVLARKDLDAFMDLVFQSILKVSGDKHLEAAMANEILAQWAPPHRALPVQVLKELKMTDEKAAAGWHMLFEIMAPFVSERHRDAFLGVGAHIELWYATASHPKGVFANGDPSNHGEMELRLRRTLGRSLLALSRRLNARVASVTLEEAIRFMELPVTEAEVKQAYEKAGVASEAEVLMREKPEWKAFDPMSGLSFPQAAQRGRAEGRGVPARGEGGRRDARDAPQAPKEPISSHALVVAFPKMLEFVAKREREGKPPVWTDLPVCLRFLLGGVCKSTGAHEDRYHWGAQEGARLLSNFTGLPITEEEVRAARGRFLDTMDKRSNKRARSY